MGGVWCYVRRVGNKDLVSVAHSIKAPFKTQHAIETIRRRDFNVGKLDRDPIGQMTKWPGCPWLPRGVTDQGGFELHTK